MLGLSLVSCGGADDRSEADEIYQSLKGQACPKPMEALARLDELEDPALRDQLLLEVTADYHPRSRRFCERVVGAAVQKQCNSIAARPHLHGDSPGCAELPPWWEDADCPERDEVTLPVVGGPGRLEPSARGLLMHCGWILWARDPCAPGVFAVVLAEDDELGVVPDDEELRSCLAPVHHRRTHPGRLVLHVSREAAEDSASD